MVKRKGISEREKEFNVMVGQRICRARKVAGLNASQLASVVGISDAQVYWYEVGRNRCPPFVLNAFAQRMKISLRDLVPNITTSGIPEDSSDGEAKLF
jgi:transcriptional regulator with XRE-family HTH domain